MNQQPTHASTGRVGGVQGDDAQRRESQTPAVRDRLSTSADRDSGGRGAHFAIAFSTTGTPSAARQKVSRSAVTERL